MENDLYLETLRELLDQHVAAVRERNELRAAIQRVMLGDRHVLHPAHSPQNLRRRRVMSRWMEFA